MFIVPHLWVSSPHSLFVGVFIVIMVHCPHSLSVVVMVHCQSPIWHLLWSWFVVPAVHHPPFVIWHSGCLSSPICGYLVISTSDPLWAVAWGGFVVPCGMAAEDVKWPLPHKNRICCCPASRGLQRWQGAQTMWGTDQGWAMSIVGKLKRTVSKRQR